MSLESRKSQIDHEWVRHRAHELYLERNGAPGSEIEDWLQAEREFLVRGDRPDEAPSKRVAGPATKSEIEAHDPRAKAAKSGS